MYSVAPGLAAGQQGAGVREHDRVVVHVHHPGLRRGFLRAEATQDDSASKNGSGSFLGAHQVRHLNIAATRRFQVHPMFHAYLDIGTAGPRKVSRSKTG